MSKFRFVFVSKDDSFMMPREATSALAAACPEFRFDYVAGNAMPLAQVYNRLLDEDNSGFDYVALMHADVRLDVEGLARHVDSVAGKYDLIGLCGCHQISTDQSPLNWFNGSNGIPGARWGFVTHGQLGGQPVFYNRHYLEVTDHSAVCLDGLCLIFPKATIGRGLRFDESLGGFDCYDTDLCFQATMKYGMKPGVVVRKDLVHYSAGMSITKDDFLKIELKLRRKWGLKVPPGSKLEKLIQAGTPGFV